MLIPSFIHKAQPTASDLHIDRLLTNISIAYLNPTYIADQIFPMVKVMKQSDRIPLYNQSFWFRDDPQVRGPGQKSVRGGFEVDNSAIYFADRFSRGFEIPDEIRRNADLPYNLDRDGTRFVTDRMFMRREVAFATDFFKTGVWTTDKVGGVDFTKWSDFGGSTPVVDVDTFKDEVEALSAQEPNYFTMGKQGWVITKNHPTLLDRIKFTQRAQLTSELVASLFEFEKFLIGRSIQTTDPEGTAEASVTYSRIWGKNALMLYVPATASLLSPAAGYSFVWQVVPNALQYIKRMRDEEREIDIIEANSWFDQKITSARSGLFMSALVA